MVSFNARIGNGEGSREVLNPSELQLDGQIKKAAPLHHLADGILSCGALVLRDELRHSLIMRTLLKLFSVVLGVVGLSDGKASALTGAKSLFELAATDVDGVERKLSDYSGKVVLVVNVASRCGFTGQYEGLEKLFKQYEAQGFVVLAFPSNDFLGQEPGSNEEIKTFCQTKFNVTFPVFSKGSVTGDDKQPVFKFITEEADPRLAGRVMWNFEKFLFDRNGKLIERYRSMTAPESTAIVGKIEELLKQPRAEAAH